ncbi:aspartate dehydrogenase [Herbaspirillum sp. NPDC087042]|uniref:aspartate dehydrogenase n=1 Tax=Herbaspirillum sp. NPDC087042 TaxID=3364004 RepID=UPI00381EEB20
MHTIALAGLGAIGRSLLQDMPDGIRISAVAARNEEAARAYLATAAPSVAVVPLAQLAGQADIVIECAGPGVLEQIAAPALHAGKHLVAMSAGALLLAPGLLALREQYRHRFHLPSGAIGGLDAVAAMAEGEIRSARLVTRKPPAALRDVAWLDQQGIVVAQLRQPQRVFSGTAAEAVRHFPDNLNVAAALSLAGIGPQRTRVELWIDPGISSNCHAIEVESDSGRLQFTIQAQPSVNPGTSSLAARSALALLRRLAGSR